MHGNVFKELTYLNKCLKIPYCGINGYQGNFDVNYTGYLDDDRMIFTILFVCIIKYQGRQLKFLNLFIYFLLFLLPRMIKGN